MLPSLLSTSKNPDQKSKVDQDKNKNVLKDSAKENYFSSLADENDLSEVLNNAFVINKPLDTVGGDGYWVCKIKSKSFLVVFDCMGHGRLASMMTRTYIELIDQAIRINGIYDPASILDQIHDQIKKQFENKENMLVGAAADIAVVQLDNSERKLFYSGAKMDLIAAEKGEIIKYKSHKRAVGRYFDVDRKYETTSIPFQKETKYYLFTDGVTDLFGGPDDKKLGSKHFLEMLKVSSNSNITGEKVNIFNQLNRWSSNKKRLDDLLLIGFKPL